MSIDRKDTYCLVPGIHLYISFFFKLHFWVAFPGIKEKIHQPLTATFGTAYKVRGLLVLLLRRYPRVPGKTYICSSVSLRMNQHAAQLSHAKYDCNVIHLIRLYKVLLRRRLQILDYLLWKIMWQFHFNTNSRKEDN